MTEAVITKPCEEASNPLKYRSHEPHDFVAREDGWAGPAYHCEGHQECGAVFEDSEDRVPPTCTLPFGHEPVPPGGDDANSWDHANPARGAFWNELVPMHPGRDLIDMVDALNERLAQAGSLQTVSVVVNSITREVIEQIAVNHPARPADPPISENDPAILYARSVAASLDPIADVLSKEAMGTPLRDLLGLHPMPEPVGLAGLTFTTDGEHATTYQLDRIANTLLGGRARHPEAKMSHDMPPRDRALAIALLTLALEALEEPEFWS